MKKLAILLLTLISATIMLTAATATTNTPDINDALNILKHLAKLEMLSAAQQQTYDYDGNGAITINDALEVLKYLAKLDNLISNRVIPSVTTTQPTVTTAAQPTTNPSINEIIRLINLERANADRPALSADYTLLHHAAGVRAEEATRLLEHTRPDGSEWFTVLDELNADWQNGTELISWSRANNPAQSIMNFWMGDPEQRTSILNSSYTHIGVGIANNSVGTPHFVVMLVRSRFAVSTTTTTQPTGTTTQPTGTTTQPTGTTTQPTGTTTQPTGTTTTPAATTAPVTTATPATTTVQIVPLSDFDYTIRMGVAEIISYKGNSADVVVPDTIEGNPVAIRPNVFAQSDGLKSVTFIEQAPESYVAHRPFQAAVAYRAPEHVPARTVQEFSHMRNTNEVLLPEMRDSSGRVIRATVYRQEAVYTTRIIPGYTIPEVPARDAVPAREASGMSENMFGETEGFTVYVPASALTAYRSLFPDLTIQPASAGTGIFGISVKTPPAKSEYIEGQVLDTDGISVEVRNWDGTTRNITSGFTVSETELDTVGTNRILVTYEGKQSWFDVEVLLNAVVGLEILTLPDKLDYFTGEEIDITGLSLEITYLNGKTAVINEGFFYGSERIFSDYQRWKTLSGIGVDGVYGGFSSGDAGTRTVYVFYDEVPDDRFAPFFHDTFEVEITQIIPVSVELLTPVFEVDWGLIAPLSSRELYPEDIGDIQIQVTYNDGTVVNMALGEGNTGSGASLRVDNRDGFWFIRTSDYRVPLDGERSFSVLFQFVCWNGRTIYHERITVAIVRYRG
jgi:uncharacterized protein YkwD